MWYWFYLAALSILVHRFWSQMPWSETLMNMIVEVSGATIVAFIIEKYFLNKK